MKFAKIVFRVAGIYGLLVVAPLYLAEGYINSTNPPAITHPEYYYGFVGVTLAWQILFLILSRDPLRYRAMMIPSIVEKATFAVAILVLWSQNRVGPSVLLMQAIDSLLGILFLIAYIKTTPAKTRQENIAE